MKLISKIQLAIDKLINSSSSKIPNDFLASNLVLEESDIPINLEYSSTQIESCNIKPVRLLLVWKNGKLENPSLLLFNTYTKYRCVRE